jgi:hypothetical protein
MWRLVAASLGLRHRPIRCKRRKQASAVNFTAPFPQLVLLPDNERRQGQPDAQVRVEIAAVFVNQPRRPIINIAAAQVGHRPFGPDEDGSIRGVGLGQGDFTMAVNPL